MFWTIAMAAIAAFWIGFVIFGKRQPSKTSDGTGPKELFLDLCRLHHLSRSQRTLLEAAVADSKPEEMCRVFVDPSYLNRIVRTASAHPDDYRQIQRQLFGGSGS